MINFYVYLKSGNVDKYEVTDGLKALEHAHKIWETGYRWRRSDGMHWFKPEAIDKICWDFDDCKVDHSTGGLKVVVTLIDKRKNTVWVKDEFEAREKALKTWNKGHIMLIEGRYEWLGKHWIEHIVHDMKTEDYLSDKYESINQTITEDKPTLQEFLSYMSVEGTWCRGCGALYDTEGKYVNNYSIMPCSVETSQECGRCMKKEGNTK